MRVGVQALGEAPALEELVIELRQKLVKGEEVGGEGEQPRLVMEEQVGRGWGEWILCVFLCIQQSQYSTADEPLKKDKVN